nr:exopolyphosphatase / guanosine-5-triphosphate,3-diphosphate pyrophosphatase [Candidatus Cloacimonadota bacterium]
MPQNSETILLLEFGSNTCKVMLWDSHNAQVLVDYRLPLRLAAELSKRKELSENGVNSMISAIRDVQNRFKDARKIIAIGTQTLRKAKNAQQIVQKIKEKCGVTIKILSPQEEAQAAFKGVQASIKPKGNTIYFDIGGGSTEIIFAKDQRVYSARSYELGAVSLHQKFHCTTPISNCNYYHVQQEILRTIKPIKKNIENMVGSGGSVVTCAMVALGITQPNEDLINGHIIRRSAIIGQIQRYRALSAYEIAKIPGMDPSRADIILPAAMIIIGIMDLYQKPDFIASTKGVRHGMI